MQPSIGAQLNRASSPIRQRLRSGKRYVVDLHWDSLNNLSDCTVEELTRYIEELGNPLRSDSFSSIATVSAREDFETAIDNIKQGIFLFGALRWSVVARSVVKPLLTPSIAAVSDGPNSVPTASSAAPFRARTQMHE
ncbi:hypothetical protein RB195_014281 [Necator americanus]|uniref:Uncharacterized protein n=1 Tax=Necator americanus TaxID=51031 RepID=A0ABR1DZD0_NECAM